MANTFSLKKLLEKNGIDLKKSLGQNFLTDDYYPEKIAESASEISTGVIEIGPGAGALTRHLCRHFKRAAAIELDKRMKPLLDEALAEFDNCEIIYGDVLKVDLAKIIDDMKVDSVSVVANLPYYITTPIIMKLLESRLFTRITVMVQKEVAARLTASKCDAEYGAITAVCNYYAKVKKLFNVSAGSFSPPPKVDSSVVMFDIYEKPPVKPLDEQTFFSVIKAAFAQRRKMFANSFNSCFNLLFTKEEICDMLIDIGLKSTVRGEEMDIYDFARISDYITRKKQ